MRRASCLHIPRAMRSVLLVVALVAAGAWAAIRHLPEGEARAASPATAPVRTQEIQSVSLEGRFLPLHDLRAILTTRPGDQLDDARLQRDRAALEAELVRRGHLSAHVEPAVVTFGTAGGAWVSFDVTKGPVYRLGAVTVTGATERDAGVVTLTTGDDASAERIERARQVLGETLSRHGKPATVSVVLRTDHAAGVVDVELAAGR